MEGEARDRGERGEEVRSRHFTSDFQNNVCRPRTAS